ncbi:helix-turn-helix transcriptional regulator [Chromobacterium haemolyticum]|nr:helix-turn-helix transcriptional regulator [Chromobacterium haemolyticum]
MSGGAWRRHRWGPLVAADRARCLRRCAPFGDFQRSLGVARNILSDRLRKLVDAEVLATQAASDGSAYQEYVLTAKGESLFAVVLALRQWGERYLFEPGEPHSLLIDKGSGQPVPLMLPKTQDGAALLPAATEVRKLT